MKHLLIIFSLLAFITPAHAGILEMAKEKGMTEESLRKIRGHNETGITELLCKGSFLRILPSAKNIPITGQVILVNFDSNKVVMSGVEDRTYHITKVTKSTVSFQLGKIKGSINRYSGKVSWQSPVIGLPDWVYNVDCKVAKKLF